MLSPIGSRHQLLHPLPHTWYFSFLHRDAVQPDGYDHQDDGAEHTSYNEAFVVSFLDLCLCLRLVSVTCLSEVGDLLV
jgi:hypothetical protein